MNTTLSIEIQQLMQVLQLRGEERTAWSQLLPVMNEIELSALKDNLKQQVDAMTSLYLTALEQKSA